MRTVLITLLLFSGIFSIAQAQESEAHIIFEWRDILYAQPTGSSGLIQIIATREGYDTLLDSDDVYSLNASPLSQSPTDDYGYHHGVWSRDKSQFVYLEIAPPDYRVRLVTQAGADVIVLDSQFSGDLAYLDPLAWTDDGDILLLERRSLYHLPEVKVYRLDLESGVLEFHFAVNPGHLVGRTALLPDGHTAFIGFATDRALGILLDTSTGEIRNFSTRLDEILPPVRGFEHYPLRVLGSISHDDLNAYASKLSDLPHNLAERPFPAPFLHWSLADHRRMITCYLDSEWTDQHFDTNCPGLGGHDYEGHRGTDISAEPDGLPIGTPVYPAAIGTVVATYRNCDGRNPSCNSSYGNTVTLEHLLVVEGEIQAWYTGYGHLQMSLIDNGAIISDLTQPIALSGATGVGGAHLHVEVRDTDGVVDPWDDRHGHNLWLGDPERPLALVEVDDMTGISKVLDVCTAYAGNNIRAEAGTSYATIGKTTAGTTYFITDTAYVGNGDAVGEWYQVVYAGGEGWLWSGILNCS